MGHLIKRDTQMEIIIIKSNNPGKMMKMMRRKINSNNKTILE